MFFCLHLTQVLETVFRGCLCRALAFYAYGQVCEPLGVNDCVGSTVEVYTPLWDVDT